MQATHSHYRIVERLDVEKNANAGKGRIWMMLVLLTVVPLAARADQKDALKKKGDAAAAAGRVFEARDAYCPLADLDPNYPQAKMLCSAMKKQAETEDVRCDTRFNDASTFLSQNKFDDAEQKLIHIQPGCKRYDDAKKLLTVKIPQEQFRDEIIEPSHNMLEGGNAYFKNDFTGAKTALGQVSGSEAGKAQDLLNKIKQYEQAMAEGDRLAQSGNIRQALATYAEAQQIKADGPGNPAIKKTLERFLQDHLYYNLPTKMTLGETERIEIGLAEQREPYSSKTDLPGRGAVRAEQIGDGPLLKVVPRSLGFDIKPLNDAEQRVEWNGRTRWAWKVTPTSWGKQSIYLRASLRLKPGLGNEARDLLQSERVIEVEVVPASPTRVVLVHYWYLWAAGVLLIIVALVLRARR